MGLTLPVLIEDPMLRQTNFGRAIGFLYGSNTLGAVAGAVLGEGYLIAAFGLRGTSLAAGLVGCVAAAVALIRGEIRKRHQRVSLQRTFPLRCGCELSAAVASAFRQLWDGLHSSYAGSDLVSISAVVCCIVADCFRNHAGGCACRNWARRHRGWRDSSALGTAESIPSCPATARRNCIAFVISILSG